MHRGHWTSLHYTWKRIIVNWQSVHANILRINTIFVRVGRKSAVIVIKLDVPIRVNRRRYTRDWKNFYRIRKIREALRDLIPVLCAGPLPIGLTAYKHDKWREYRECYIMLGAMENHLHQWLIIPSWKGCCKFHNVYDTRLFKKFCLSLFPLRFQIHRNWNK